MPCTCHMCLSGLAQLLEVSTADLRDPGAAASVDAVMATWRKVRNGDTHTAHARVLLLPGRRIARLFWRSDSAPHTSHGTKLMGVWFRARHSMQLQQVVRSTNAECACALAAVSSLARARATGRCCGAGLHPVSVSQKLCSCLTAV
jgi:hypothetical protein